MGKACFKEGEKSLTDLAKELGCDRSTLNRLVDYGKLPEAPRNQLGGRVYNEEGVKAFKAAYNVYYGRPPGTDATTKACPHCGNQLAY